MWRVDDGGKDMVNSCMPYPEKIAMTIARTLAQGFSQRHGVDGKWNRVRLCSYFFLTGLFLEGPNYELYYFTDADLIRRIQVSVTLLY